MNRRLLKFRAWDPVSKRMYPEFYLFGETTCFDLISQWLMEATPEATSLMRINDAVIMQFTSLRDSKGKNIFEGDILKWHKGENNLSEVVFQNGSYFVKGINWGAYWYLADYNDKLRDAAK